MTQKNLSSWWDKRPLNEKILYIVLSIGVIWLIVTFAKKTMKSITTAISGTVENISTPDPTQDDINNANDLYQALHTGVQGWTEDEDKAVQVVMRYTKQTYPILKKAYRKTYPDEEDLTDVLTDLIDEETDLFTKIAPIING